MDKKFYEQLKDLVDIHDNCNSDGQEIFCFDLIKKIVDGEILKENINGDQILRAQKQLKESFEWFQIIGITVEYQEELMKIIS